MLLGWNTVYQLSREWHDFIVQFRKTKQIPPKPRTQNADGTCWHNSNRLPDMALNGEHYWYNSPSKKLQVPAPKGCLPCEQSARRAARVGLCCCPHTAEIWKRVHLLLMPRSSPCVLQSLPNWHCAETIFPRAVKTLKSESTTCLKRKSRENKIFTLLKFPLKSKVKWGGVKNNIRNLLFLLNLRQKTVRTRSLKYRSILHVLPYLF